MNFIRNSKTFRQNLRNDGENTESKIFMIPKENKYLSEFIYPNSFYIKFYGKFQKWLPIFESISQKLQKFLEIVEKILSNFDKISKKLWEIITPDWYTQSTLILHYIKFNVPGFYSKTFKYFLHTTGYLIIY